MNGVSQFSPNVEAERKAFGIPEAAKIIGISKSGLWALIRQGTVRPVRLGRRTLVTAAEIDRLLGSASRNGGVA